MNPETALDEATVDWLREGPGPSEWVLEAVAAHARRHPRRGAIPVPWASVVGSGILGRRLAPSHRDLRLAFVVALVAVALVAGGLLLAGASGLIVAPSTPPSTAPITSPPPSPGPSAAALTPAEVIGRNHAAWRAGRTSEIPALYADDHAVVLVGAETLTGDAHRLDGPRHFEILPAARGSVYWESRGTPFGEGANWAEPMVAGVWDPGAHGFSVYRFAPDGRIRTVWAIVRPSGGTSHEAVEASAPPTELRDFLDTCLDSLARVFGTAYADCFGHSFAEQGPWHVSADGSRGGWTSEYGDRAELITAVESRAYGTVARTGPMVSIGALVAYPFAAPDAGPCAEGIDVVELDAHGDRIAEEWTFCGAMPAAVLTLPSELAGTWAAGAETITLKACSSGDSCGRFERVDGNGEHCSYELTFLFGDAEESRFRSGTGNSFGCAWSSWSNAIVHVSVAADATLTVWTGVASRTGLARVSPTPETTPSPAR